MTENYADFYADFSNAKLTSELEVVQPNSDQVAKAVADALKQVRERSFSQRHPELGKMIKCLVCGRRHRDSIKHEQKFTTVIDRGPNEFIVPERKTPQTTKGVLGAAQFKGKRIKPHPSKHQLQFIELVRSFVPNEYSQEDLKKARSKARRILAKKLGFDFLAPKKRLNVKAA